MKALKEIFDGDQNLSKIQRLYIIMSNYYSDQFSTQTRLYDIENSLSDKINIVDEST